MTITGIISATLITIIINLRVRDHNILVKISPKICHSASDRSCCGFLKTKESVSWTVSGYKYQRSARHVRGLTSKYKHPPSQYKR